jgi:hypothetical protein
MNDNGMLKDSHALARIAHDVYPAQTKLFAPIGRSQLVVFIEDTFRDLGQK